MKEGVVEFYFLLVEDGKFWSWYVVMFDNYFYFFGEKLERVGLSVGVFIL